MYNKVCICGVDTSMLPRLNKEETNILLEKIKSGDAVAKNHFITANIRLVLSIIKRFPTNKVSYDDMFEAGCVGLIKATENFDKNYNVMFSTYAVPLIIGEVKKVLRTCSGIRVSRSIRDTAYQVLKCRSDLEKQQDKVSNKMIADKLKILESEVVYALDAISDTVSLYEPVFNKEGEELYLMDRIEDVSETDEKWTENVALKKALNKLEERQRKIIYMRYFEGRTQTEISTEVGLSQAQVSRLEKNALKILKSKIN